MKRRLAETSVSLPLASSLPDGSARVRDALTAFLELVDEELDVGRVLLLEPVVDYDRRLIVRRERLLAEVATALDNALRRDVLVPERSVPWHAGDVGQDDPASGAFPGVPFAIEDAVRAAASLLERHLRDPNRQEPLTALTEPVMAILVLPYGGPAASAHELACNPSDGL